jgi:membrane protease subunit HflC
VRAQADRTAIEIVSEADRDARVIRGESDAERNRILADAYGADQEFFAFLRSMDAYKAALTGSNTTLMIEPDSDFFTYLGSPNPRAAEPAPDGAEPPAGGDQNRPDGSSAAVPQSPQAPQAESMRVEAD